jgi:hypothetical protein
MPPTGPLLRVLLAWPLLAAASSAALAQTDPTAREPDDERSAFRAEAGLEIDSNAHRAEILTGAVNPPLVASALERLVLSWALGDVIADGQAVALSATAAAKIFDAPAARDEDLAIAESSAAWQRSLGADGTLALSGAYYEAFQRSSLSAADLTGASQRRDFRSLAPTSKLGLALGQGLDLSIAAGYRWFVFKPDRDYDFSAPVVALDLRWARQPESGADWEAALGASYEHRTFGGPALVDACAPPTPGLPCSSAVTRVDDLWLAHLEAVRTGRVLVGAGYAFQANLSNSSGETVTRHFLSARLATALPAGLAFAARGELLLASYAGQLPVGQLSPGSPFVSIEDENRSSVRVDLSRDLGDRLRAIARYTFYANEITAAPISYRRQTLLLSLTYNAEK